MIIEIENPSSPGASFTSNTNNVLLKTYEWICDNNGLTISYKEFRNRLQQEKDINNNNSRNIHPLLKNCDLVYYDNRGNISVDYFFTNTGLAYIKTIQTEKMIVEGDFSGVQKDESIKKLEVVRQNIIYDALLKLVCNKEINYVKPLQNLVKYILEYDRVDKVEFAYLVYMTQSISINEALEEMNANINMYRQGNLTIEVNVRVRNDIELRKKIKSDKRKEGLGFLTSYGYFVSLLVQAGLLKKEDNYYCVNNNKKLLKTMGEICDEQ